MKPGTHLGPYRVEALLGEGGMGRVYRGVDTRLDRIVAIKVLPPHLSSNPQLRERFEREARAISSLSHPHICTLYDIGLQDGTDYLVMEHLEGETLADRLASGPLPLQEAIRYGCQIADALAKAHRQGVIHRDLKPGNVMITTSGAKLLDFGLAKIASAAVAAPDAPTEHQRPLTAEGTLLGTFQYMAPEQLEGLDADARTDIFALGAVLYEMVTGRRAFDGKTRTSMIAAIVGGEPRPVNDLQPLTPPALEHIIAQCLRKEPEQRWQSAHDVAEELRWVADGGPGGAGEPVAGGRGAGLATILGGLVLLALGLGVGFAAAALLGREEPAAVLQASIVPPPGVDISPTGAGDRLVLSPDGRALAFTARDSAGKRLLWVRLLAQTEARPLPATDDATDPFWAPDGRSLAFFSHGKLRTIALDGSPPVALCDVASNPLVGAWSRDGVILYSPASGAPLHRVPAAGGAPAAVTTLDTAAGETTHRWPRFLPDGESFLYLAGSHDLPRNSEVNAIYATRLGESERKLILRAASNFEHVDGHLLFVRNATLFAQRFDPDRLEVTGEPIAVANGVHHNVDSFYSAFAVSPSGRLVYSSADARRSRQLVWLDATGKQTGVLAAADDYQTWSLSPSRTMLAVTIEDPTVGRDIWLQDLASGGLRRLTLQGSGSQGVWAPDGRNLVYRAEKHDPGERHALYVRSADGQGEAELLWPGVGWGGPISWSPDGRHLALWRFDPATATGYDAFVLALGGERRLVPLAATRASEFPWSFSSDGAWVLYTSDLSGREEVYLASLPDLAGRVQVSFAGGTNPSWADSREIWFRQPDGAWVTVALEESVGAPPEVSSPRPLFRDEQIHTLERAAGDRLLALRVDGGGEPSAIVLISDWRALIGHGAR